MKTLIKMLLVLVFAGSVYGQDGLILINRSIGGTTILPRSDFDSHTFVAYVENGQVVRTASWGSYSWWGTWTVDPIGNAGAQSAFNAGQYEMVLSGGSVSAFDDVWNFISGSAGHPNLGVVLSCKNEAWNFYKFMKKYLEGVPLHWGMAGDDFAETYYTSADPYFYSQGELWDFIRSRMNVQLDMIMRQTDPDMKQYYMENYLLLMGKEKIEEQNQL